MRKLTVEEHSGRDALSTLASEWRALFDSSEAPPFLSWEWISAWLKWLGGEKNPRLFCVREGKLMVGLLPLGEEERRLKGSSVRLRQLSFLGDGPGGSDYLDVLALPGYEQECARLLFGHIAENVEFDIMDLDGMPIDSPSAPWIAWRFEGSKFKYHLEPRYVCPQLKLDKPWEELIQSVSRSTHLKRSLARLRKTPDFDYRIVVDPEGSADAFERFLVLHELSWAGRGGSGATGLQSLKDFHRDVVGRLAHAGFLRFEEIWLGGACRASLYGICGGNQRFYYYLSGYDPAWSKFSLGRSLMGLSIASAIERGVKCYDLLRGSEAYKFDWANETRATMAAQVSSDSLPARMSVMQDRLAEAARSTAHALLPSGALALWRRWRKGQIGKSEPVDDGDRSSVNEEKSIGTAAL